MNVLQQEIREQASSFQKIFENSSLGIFQSSLEGRFLRVNKAFATLLGYNDSDDLKKSIHDIEKQFYHYPEHRLEILSTVKTRDGVAKFKTELRRKDGVIIRCSSTTWGVRNDSGKLSHLEGFIEDVTHASPTEEHVRELRESLARENQELRKHLKGRCCLGKIIGKSAPMQELYEDIIQAAGSDTAIIVYGESGTGKELVARAIHQLSSRGGREFVPVNCGAIPEHLLESEFFGHSKGAFTSAVANTRGYLDRADGGTLFLDEVGELRLEMQAKLLRAIENGSYFPVGNSKSSSSDFRLISATNRNLREMVRNGSMREDFYYRIDIIPIGLPPLRERREDIPFLINHFLCEFTGLEIAPPLPGHVLEFLYKYDYPGNVRELQNILRRYLSTGKLDLPGHVRLSTDISADPIPNGSLEEMLNAREKEIIEKCLIENRWRRGPTAAALGIDRKTLYTRMKLYGLNFPKSG